jgi:hypothetical protein
MRKIMPPSDESSLERVFGLSRPNFILDPGTDWECFARRDINVVGIVEGLRIDLVTQVAPKRLLWGPYGGGKTHTLYRTLHELGRLTSIYSMRVECPDLSSRSGFGDLYRDGIMPVLGEDAVIGLFERAIEQVPVARRDEYLRRLREFFGDEPISKAVAQLMNPNFERIRLWAWISGISLNRGELNDLGQTQDLASAEPARLAEMLILIGRVMKKIDGKTVVLCLDEMERVKGVGKDSINTFVTGFTRLMDPNQRDVAVLLGCSAQLFDEMPDIFASNGPVVSRIGSQATIEIPHIPDPDVDGFIRQVIGYVRDRNANIAELVGGAGNTHQETLGVDFFPFTNEAIQAMKSRLSRDMTPREITITMTQTAGRAFLMGRRVVTSDLIT